MNMRLDLFQLHEPEDNRDARAWILASGKNLNRILKGIETEILSKTNKLELVNSLLPKLDVAIKLSEYKDPEKILSFWITNKRADLKLYKNDLAKSTGTSGRDWTNIENGKRLPSCQKLRKIINILGGSPIFDFNCKNNDFCLRSLNYLIKSLNFEDDFVPIVIVSELLSFWKEILNKPKSRFEEKKLEILENIEWLKTNQYSSKPIKAAKEITEDLAKIIGAFCADGNFFPPEMIRWEEEYKDNMEALGNWFDNTFGIKVKIERPIRKQKRNSWQFKFRNKVFARYLEVFFKFRPEVKKYTVTEPQIIKNCSLNIRKNFAKGALMFDGSVNTDFSANFFSVSKAFIDSMADILKKELDITVSQNHNKDKMWSIIISLVSPKNRNLLNYFEQGTIKWKRLNGFINGFDKPVKNLEEAKFLLDNSYPKLRGEKFSEILDMIIAKKEFDVYDLLENINIDRTVLLKRLKLLIHGNILTKKMVNRRYIYFVNDKIEEWKLPDAVDLNKYSR